MHLNSACLTIKNIPVDIQKRMFELMEIYYENMHYETFEADLKAKDHALLLYNQEGILQGFTTIKCMELFVDGVAVQLIFSGDTIIHKDYWGDVELHRSWIQTVFNLVTPEHKQVYWLLISKGYKTYRFLPVYFKTFYPHYDEMTPAFEKHIMDAFGYEYYKDFYCPSRGIVSFNGQKDYLKKGVADISEKQLKDQHIQFFLYQNPGYGKGDELVCLTRLAYDNIRSRGLRYLGVEKS